MNCGRCHHTDEAHAPDGKSSSMIKAGRCAIPGCTCSQYREPFDSIDEEML